MIKANLVVFSLLFLSYSAIIQNPLPSTNGTKTNSTQEEIYSGRSVFAPTDNLSFLDVLQPVNVASVPTSTQSTNQTSSTNSPISAQPVIFTNTSSSTYTTNTANATQNSVNRSIEGSYQLKLPTQSFRIRNNSLILTMCNTHIFTISVSKVTVGTSTVAAVRIALSSSTKLICQQDYDSYYTGLLTKVTLYEFKEDSITFYKSNGVVASAKRNIYMTLPSTKVDGRWELEIPSLPLKISNSRFDFEGCNKQSMGYTLAPVTKQISLKNPASTLKNCNINNDRIFIDALTRSNFYEIGETSFTLYDKNGEGSAYGTLNV